MKFKKILIVEDEKPNADRLKRLLLKLRPTTEILSIEDSIESSVYWLENNPMPDLIMMDVRLSDGLSFEIFNKVDIRCPVIFTTAYDEYAVKAFKYNSVDYLLKPIEEEELNTALQRYEGFMESIPFVGSALEGLLNYIQPKEYRKRFLIASKDGYKALLTDDILYFSTDLGITKAQLESSSEIIPHTLEELEKQLDPKSFFRANRQFIININSIASVINDFNGKLKIELINNPDTELIISREKASTFKAWMDF
ncbi:LytR/AlgR family response regulator transcription factor [Chryseobacterium sp. CP-77]|uniref:LytR/AlgR family response regulator transcription factor n=1 Tax=Chryseobacterium sp. CP-77 TaxID=3116594 RepID=UPI002ED477CB